MKRLAIFITSLTAVLSCSGNIDPVDNSVELTLKADVTEIVADGKSAAVFTVLSGTDDVTGMASITCTSGSAVISENRFSTTKEGIYTFTASYNGKTSGSLQITATAPVVSRFQRHVCIMEFTGTWCSMCPDGAQTLNYLVTKTYKDKAFALAFHNSDIYTIPQEAELKKIFGWESYPAYVTDMRADGCGLLNDGSCSATIEKSLYDIPTHCAAGVECTLAGDNVTVKAKIFSEKTGQYRLAAYVVEDKVVGEQTMGTGEVRQDYTHRHVVRQMLSANVRGDDMGTIEAEKEQTHEYTFTFDAGKWNKENLSVAVLAINEDGHVNNMAACAADGGEMDYVYLK